MEAHIIEKSDTLVVWGDLIYLNTKNKDWPRQENKGEVDPSSPFKEGDVPWFLKKDDISLIKEV